MTHSKETKGISMMPMLLMVVLVMAAFTPLLQGQGIGNRTGFVFHLYVNPQTGDDTLAAQYNPQGFATATEALSPHPFNQYGAIQHAPYEFRTVTAAINYINTTFYNWGTPSKPIPWTNSTGLTIEHVVIHCLPGIYAPWLTGENEPIDPKNGLIYNGETFPIQMPENVSIQGASSLEVIFDGRGRDGAHNYIFDFNIALGNGPSYVDSFIDGITIRNVRSSKSMPAPNGAGIVIAGESNIQVVISNCIITDCHVGIAVDAYPSNPLIWCHSPILVNNTIAWNWIGIYSGEINNWPGNSAGYGRPRLYNNIIDSRDPDNQFPFTSCFEGLDPSDLTVQQIAGVSVGIDFNAYDNSYNLLDTTKYPPGWSQNPTAVRSGSPSYKPRVNLDNFKIMGASSVLYINDCFRVTEGWGDNYTSRSPHDFRLSPMVYTDEAEIFLNPLVNMGIDTSTGTLQFANYYTPNPLLAPVIGRAPGLPGPGSQDDGGAMDLAALHAEDWDLEEFGNSRIEIAPLFPAPPSPSTHIDIGADEVGSLIMAGYIDGTRIHSRVDADMVKYPGRTAGYPSGDNSQVYFFNVYTPGNSYTRPQYSAWTSQSFYIGTSLYTGTWWNYMQAVPAVPHPNGRYTQGHDDYLGSPTVRRSLVLGLGWEEFMRSRECDFSSSLLPDTHPLWGGFFTTDVFAPNPWYHHNSAVGASQDNIFLYYSSTWQVTEGTINPPGTQSWSPTNGHVYTDAFHPLVPYFDMQNRGLSTYSVNTWGYGEASLPVDYIESTSWQGRRYNCQLLQDEGISNLQSFIGINETDDSDPHGG